VYHRQLAEPDLIDDKSSNYGHFAVVERLLQDKRVDPSASDNFAIRLASTNGHLAVVALLKKDSRVIKEHDNPSSKGNKCLIM
jgi:surface antigen